MRGESYAGAADDQGVWVGDVCCEGFEGGEADS